MFVQVIEGQVSDRAGLRRQADRWDQELRPGATGYLGTTGGVAADGHALVFARFDSPEAAAANSDRPEQAAWWAETERLFDGPVTFHDSTDVEELLGGVSDGAGFVQVMKYGVTDRSKAAEMDRRFTEMAPRLRPDVLGSLRVWTTSTSCIDATFFTSEAEAREAEAKPMPPEMQEAWEEFGPGMGEVEFIDLSESWSFRP